MKVVLGHFLKAKMTRNVQKLLRKSLTCDENPSIISGRVENERLSSRSHFHCRQGLSSEMNPVSESKGEFLFETKISPNLQAFHLSATRTILSIIATWV
jgi:hypothetical protein